VFSGHADQNGLLDFVKQQNPKKTKKIFLSHGEEESMMEFSSILNGLGFNDVILPRKEETFEL
jgi:metallo-beta-lactamase family protein